MWVNGFKERGFKELSFVLHVELEKCLKRVQNRKFEKWYQNRSYPKGVQKILGKKFHKEYESIFAKKTDVPEFDIEENYKSEEQILNEIIKKIKA